MCCSVNLVSEAQTEDASTVVARAESLLVQAELVEEVVIVLLADGLATES